MVLAGSTKSAGQLAAVPGQFSSGSHESPEPVRQTVVAGSKFGKQVPAPSQVSRLSQRSEDGSPQAAPAMRFENEHVPSPRQNSLVQSFPSLQSASTAQGTQPAISVPAQTPAKQVSVSVHASLSSQGLTLSKLPHVPSNWHKLSVHGLESSHSAFEMHSRHLSPASSQCARSRHGSSSSLHTPP